MGQGGGGGSNAYANLVSHDCGYNVYVVTLEQRKQYATEMERSLGNATSRRQDVYEDRHSVMKSSVSVGSSAVSPAMQIFTVH